MRKGGKEIELARSDIQDWTITFVDTGLHSNIGQRLMAVKHLLDGEERFLANYSDGLSDLELDKFIELSSEHNKIASFLAVRTAQSFHSVSVADGGLVTGFGKVSESDFWVNGGYFLFHKEIFDYIREGEELVEAPFGRLIEAQQLFAYRYKGFWSSMDTFKDKITFDRMYARGHAPWEVWNRGRGGD